MTVYGYVRVSTVEQATGGSSLDAQQSQIAGYCQMRGWPERPVFHIETAVSGSVKLEARPQGLAMLSRLVTGDAVVVTKLDRMFRDTFDALATLEKLKAAHVSLHMIDLGGDVVGNGVSKLVFTILSGVAEMERNRIRDRIREVKADMKARGKHHGGPRPFGYAIVDGRQVPLPEEQAAIERMRVLRNERLSHAAIADEIRELGYDLWPKQVGRILARAELAS